MASATGLYNLNRGGWDEELCQVCCVSPKRLPIVADSASGTLTRPHPLAHAHLCNAIGDGAAGNLGSGADRQGVAAINIGTSAAVRMMQTDRQAAATKVPFGLFRYRVDAQRSVIGGAVSNAGNLRVWCLRELRLEEAAVDRALSRTAAAIDPLTILPFWVGERAPTWPDRQLGLINGLNQATAATDILRATETAVFYRLAQILELIEDATAPSRRVIVSGGIVHSVAAIRLLADAIGRDVEIAREAEASLRGAAVHALNQMGIEVGEKSASKMIKCNRVLAAKHRRRRQRQIDFEKIVTSAR
jgi:gluconokinase